MSPDSKAQGDRMFQQYSEELRKRQIWKLSDQRTQQTLQRPTVEPQALQLDLIMLMDSLLAMSLPEYEAWLLQNPQNIFSLNLNSAIEGPNFHQEST